MRGTQRTRYIRASCVGKLYRISEKAGRPPPRVSVRGILSRTWNTILVFAYLVYYTWYLVYTGYQVHINHHIYSPAQTERGFTLSQRPSGHAAVTGAFPYPPSNYLNFYCA